jgi:hypothetical protein
MAGLHAVLAAGAALGVALLLAAAVAASAGCGRGRHWLDRAILVQAGAAAAAGVTGIILLPGGNRPTDPLHFLYGAVLVALPLGLRLVAGRRPTQRVGSWLVVGSLIAGGVLVRAFMTGA